MSKRPRHIACRTCRERKIRCDGQQPCSRCAGQSQPCVYATPSSSEAGTSDLTQQLQMMNDRLSMSLYLFACHTPACELSLIEPLEQGEPKPSWQTRHAGPLPKTPLLRQALIPIAAGLPILFRAPFLSAHLPTWLCPWIWNHHSQNGP